MTNMAYGVLQDTRAIAARLQTAVQCLSGLMMAINTLVRGAEARMQAVASSFKARAEGLSSQEREREDQSV